MIYVYKLFVHVHDVVLVAVCCMLSGKGSQILLKNCLTNQKRVEAYSSRNLSKNISVEEMRKIDSR